MKVSQLLNELQAKKSNTGYAELTPNTNVLDHNKMIYIVKRSHGWYKIGVTKNIDNRIAQMQSYSPEKLSLVSALPLEGMVYFIERAVLNTLRNNHKLGLLLRSNISCSPLCNAEGYEKCY
jgi:predicted GIY-YIG superfamily endonuclease